MENASYLLSQFFARFAEKFRQIKAYPLKALIYYLKSLPKSGNYEFLRKFAQLYWLWCSRRGFNLIICVEKPGNHCGPWEFYPFKNDQFSITIICNNSLFLKILSFLWIQVWILVFKIYLVQMIQKWPLSIVNHAFVESAFANFGCVSSRKIFQSDSIFASFSTLCHYYYAMTEMDIGHLMMKNIGRHY